MAVGKEHEGVRMIWDIGTIETPLSLPSSVCQACQGKGGKANLAVSKYFPCRACAGTGEAIVVIPDAK